MGKASDLAAQLAGQLDQLETQLDRVGSRSASLPAGSAAAVTTPAASGIGRRDLRAMEKRIVRQLQPVRLGRGVSFDLAARRTYL